MTDPTDPTRHWDGQQWLKWDGAQWAPEAPIAAPLSPPPPPPPPAYAAPSPALPVKKSRTPLVLGIIGAVLLVLIIGGIAAAMSGSKTPVAAASSTPVASTPSVTPSTAPSVAPSTAPSQAPSDAGPANLKLGVGGAFTDDSGDAGTIEAVSAVSHKTGIGPLAEKPKYGRYLVVTVFYTEQAGSNTYNPFDWHYQTADGTTYDAANGNALFAGFEPALHSGTLKPGQKVRGVVTFDVPAGAGLLQVDDGIGGTLAQWQVP